MTTYIKAILLTAYNNLIEVAPVIIFRLFLYGNHYSSQ